MIKKELLLASWLEKLQKKWDNEEYYYDVEEATKVFKFVSKLTNDRGASRQFELLEFQFEIITEILCVKRRSDGKRKHREAHINIPRKNGKSFLAAIIVVYLFFCQRHIFGALFILTANTTKAVQLENGIKIQLGMIKKLIDLGEENPAEEIKERTIQKMKDKTEALIDEALEPTEIQNF